MSKAIKLAAIISALTIIISSFSACEITFEKNKPENDNTTVTAAHNEEQSENVSSTTEATQASVTAQNQEKLDDIFAEIKSFKLGTIGSSSKAAELALRLIAFSASPLAQEDTLKDDAQALVASIGADELNYYGEAIYQIDLYAEDYFSGNAEEIIDLSGIGDSFDSQKSYSKTDYDKIYRLLSDY